MLHNYSSNPIPNNLSTVNNEDSQRTAKKKPDKQNPPKLCVNYSALQAGWMVRIISFCVYEPLYIFNPAFIMQGMIPLVKTSTFPVSVAGINAVYSNMPSCHSPAMTHPIIISTDITQGLLPWWLLHH